MTPLFQKLNLGPHRKLHILDAPVSFEPELAALEGVRVCRHIDESVEFALAFAITGAQRDRVCAQLVQAAQGDVVLWVAYPKKSSKRYRCEFDRDSGWQILGDAGFEPVRQVAIDEDWSALRFRRVEHIKVLKRNPERTISEAGHSKADVQRPTEAGPRSKDGSKTR